MPLEVFVKLCGELREKCLLKDTRYCSIEHQLHMLLYTLSNATCNRNAQERFEHSGETISRYFHKTLEAVGSLHSEWVTLDFDLTPDRIHQDPRFFPFFKDAVGAIDGTLIPISLSPIEGVRFRSRKGAVSQNVMACCDFDMLFKFILAGWEGAANDSDVYNDAVGKGILNE
jgi:hypothetical protein